MALKKKKWLGILILVLIVLIYLWYTGRLGEDEQQPHMNAVAYASGNDASAVSDQLLVDLRNDASKEDIDRLQRRYGLRLRLNSRYSLAERLYRSAIKRPRLAVTKLLQKLRSDPAVERAELDVIYSIPPLEAAATRFASSNNNEAAPEAFPNDPKYRYQWHMRQINMPRAWPRATGKGVIVAVIDTGVSHRDFGKRFKGVPDLANTEFVKGYDWINRHEHPLDDHGHGTHVAGTIAQSTHNGIGVTGVAYNAKIMPLKVLSARGFGSVADIADAIRFATDNGAKVINMSLGGSRPSKVLGAAVTYAVKKGVTVVCAAGNDGRGKVGFPAAYPGAIAVAATQYDRTTTFYSNWGKEIAIAAPGGNTRVDQNKDGMPDGVLQNTIRIGKPAENDYLLFMGTSMASPHVAGVAALVVERGVTEPEAVRRVLQKTAKHPKKKPDDHYGAGIVDAAAAVSKASTTWGGYKLGLGAVLALALLGLRRQRPQLRFGPAVSSLAGLLLGSAGLLFFVPGVSNALLTNGLPSWDMAILGTTSHAHPLFFSALPVILLTVLLYGVRQARPLLFGLAVGVAAHLLFHVLFFVSDVTWMPDLIDSPWLLVNSAICLGAAALLRRGLMMES